MKCPKDKTTLQKLEREGIYADCCNLCKGTYLSMSGVKSFKFNFESDVLEKALNYSGFNSNIDCPECHKTMSITKIDKIEVTICKSCYSAWFDKNKLSHLIEFVKPSKKQSKFEYYLEGFIWLPILLGLIYGLFELFS